MSAPLGRSRRAMRRGMTLLETMLTLVILVVMSGMVFETLQNSIQVNQLLENRDVTTRAARVALSKLKRELQLAYLTPNTMALERYQTVFVGEDHNPDTLYMATLAHQRLYINSRECDQTEVTVWAEDGPSERGDGQVLYHREAPRIDEEPDEQGRVYPMAYNVEEFNLRYLNGTTNEWADDWDSRGADTPYVLPRSVEIGLVLLGPDPADPDRTVEVPFLTSVILQYANPLVNPNNPFGNLAGGVGGTSSPFGQQASPNAMPGQRGPAQQAPSSRSNPFGMSGNTASPWGAK